MSRPAGLPSQSPRIHPSAFVAAAAVVVGDVRIGAGSSVWFHTVVRGDSDRIEIGEQTNLQDLTLVHEDEGYPALVGDRVTVGHRAILHGCIVGDDCLIGMGAIVLSGARVGAGSLVGAGALVREGQVVPQGSLVLGSPARVRGEVEPAHREAIARGARHYAELARAYAAGGFGAASEAAGPGDDARVGAPGLPGELEWDRWVQVLEETPGWVQARFDAAGEQAWTTGVGPGPSAHEIVVERLERDRDRDVPAMEAEIAMGPRSRSEIGPSAADALAGWATLRRAIVAGLRLRGPDAWRPGGLDGRRSLAAPVREAAARDLAARRAVLRALEPTWATR